jgi:hypothetical protein
MELDELPSTLWRFYLRLYCSTALTQPESLP